MMIGIAEAAGVTATLAGRGMIVPVTKMPFIVTIMEHLYARALVIGVTATTVGVSKIALFKILVEIMDIGLVSGTADTAPANPAGAATIVQAVPVQIVQMRTPLQQPPVDMNPKKRQR